jgi:hypothetical protein
VCRCIGVLPPASDVDHVNVCPCRSFQDAVNIVRSQQQQERQHHHQEVAQGCSLLTRLQENDSVLPAHRLMASQQQEFEAGASTRMVQGSNAGGVAAGASHHSDNHRLHSLDYPASIMAGRQGSDVASDRVTQPQQALQNQSSRSIRRGKAYEDQAASSRDCGARDAAGGSRGASSGSILLLPPVGLKRSSAGAQRHDLLLPPSAASSDLQSGGPASSTLPALIPQKQCGQPVSPAAPVSLAGTGEHQGMQRQSSVHKAGPDRAKYAQDGVM